MKYSLIRESKVVMLYEGREYHFSALSNFNADTSYTEYKIQRKTLHARTSYADSKITEMNASSFSLTLNLTSNFLEFNMLEILGMERGDNAYFLPFTYNIEPKMVTLYVINPDNRCTLFENCFISNVDFSFSKQLPLLTIGIEAATFEPTNSFPNGFSLSQGSVLPTSPVSVFSNGKELPGLTDANFSFQQQCGWRYQRSLHDINRIYSNSRAIINEMNASANLNFYYVGLGSTNIYSLEPEYGVPLSIQTKFVTVDFPSSRITKRLSHSDVYTLAYDIIPTLDSDRVSITLNGERNND
ncbi:MAG: hypothetical protein [Bacteriophage sp.]|nr:MAG: hypothetical protein [Bacteriophage sp.]